MQNSKAKTIAGWALTGLVGLFLIGGSGIPKFLDFPGKTDMMDHLGIPLALLPKLGVTEIAVAILMLIPRTSFLGAILTTAYLGGAVLTHVRAGDGPFQVLFPAVLGVLMWVGMGLRRPIVFALAVGGTCAFRDNGANP